MDILVHHLNEVFSYVSCETHIAKEISDAFTFIVPGHKFMPAYRNGMWDGKIRIFNHAKSVLYRGLIPRLAKFAERSQYSIQLPKENAAFPFTWSEKLVSESVQKYFPLTAHGKAITPNDHQLAAVAHALNEQKTLLLSPTASGKSLIAYLLIRLLRRTFRTKTLLIVPTTGLVHQMMGDFADYSSTDSSWDSDKLCHAVYSGKEKQTNKPVTISTWQSIYKQPRKFFAEYDTVVVDECHLAQANSIKSILEKTVESPWRIGMTGTLQDSKCHVWVLEGLLGPVKQVITTKELIEKKLISGLKIKCVVLKYAPEICKSAKAAKYHDEVDFLVKYRQRNEFINALVKTLKGNSLILYQYVDKHGIPLYNLINEKCKGRPIHLVHGKIDATERNDIRKLVEKSSNTILLASYGTFSTGMSIRNLHNIIFASPYKSRIRVLQSIGRGLRKGEGKTLATLYDIADDLSWKKRKNYTLNHFLKRIKIYSQENFDYEMDSVRI